MPNVTPKQLAEPELTVLVRNLRMLLAYAAEHPKRGWPTTVSELVIRSGVGRSTVYRLLPLTPADEPPPSPALEQVAALAAAFGLQSWELLWPNLDPAAPPAEVMRAVERLVGARQQHADRGGEVGDDGDTSAHRPMPSQSQKRGARRK